jgi:hypothetical protein
MACSFSQESAVKIVPSSRARLFVPDWNQLNEQTGERSCDSDPGRNESAYTSAHPNEI